MRIGTAGWVIPRQNAEMAAGEGSHLERHARVFRCVEINSSFHRSHRPATWARWAEAVPEDFRFSVKFPKAVTHQAKLAVPGGGARWLLCGDCGAGEEAGSGAVAVAAEPRVRRLPGGRVLRGAAGSVGARRPSYSLTNLEQRPS